MTVDAATQTKNGLNRKQTGMMLAVSTLVAVLGTFGANAFTSNARTTVATPIVATDITLMAFSQNAMAETISTACNRVVCQIDDLHPSILAYADTMTPDQLEAGRWAQMRLIVQALEALDGAPYGSESALMAHRELTAATRIARLYTAKLHHLR